jgi:hypothetical protein
VKITKATVLAVFVSFWGMTGWAQANDPAVLQKPVTQSEYELIMECIGTFEGAYDGMKATAPFLTNPGSFETLVASADKQVMPMYTDILKMVALPQFNFDRDAGKLAYQRGRQLTDSHREDLRSYVQAINAHNSLTPQCQSSAVDVWGRLAHQSGASGLL